ncbi:uncharacterized protein SCHCODRAFT_02616943 [Schizophyllum commune H4-8]|nr:uncharacterized protein SCHCODRAFT_02616943 [Schizophyllum commune H4-8]KAI5897226.1 hypothetical protein SCHCODRAFT_02616943 [Schizophyllum commune H4-8]
MPPEEETARHNLQQAVEISGLSLQRHGLYPCPSQKTEIQNIIGELGSDICAIDEAICRLHALRNDLVEQRAASRSVISPIRTLPSELLSEIFLFVELRIYPMVLTNGRLFHRVEPPAFACVCLEWRRAALGTPALWTDIHINAATRVHENSTFMINYLARSASLPLQVHLHAGDIRARAAFSLLARLSQLRWESLTLDACERLEPLDTPNLSAVHVTNDCSSDDIDLMFLTGASLVRNLSLALDVGNIILPPWPVISTLKLTMVGADDTEFSHANKVINSCRQTLEYLVVADNGDDPINTANSNRGKPVELPALVSIDLDNYTYAMMRTIIAPNLRSIALRRCPAHDDLGEYVLADSGLMAMQSVRCLTLVDFDFASLERLLEALDGLPNLERINVVDILCGNKFLRALADLGGGERPLRLPKLTSLSLFFRLMVGVTKDRERRQALTELMLARRADCVVNGVLVKGLKELTTNLSKDG